jgi:hypothetical protein
MSPGTLLVEIVGSLQLAALGAVQFLSHNGKLNWRDISQRRVYGGTAMYLSNQSLLVIIVVGIRLLAT